MTHEQKSAIRDLIQVEITRLGSQAAVANKCRVSPGTISFILNEKWGNVADAMWNTIESALRLEATGWQIVETTNYRILDAVLTDAQNSSLFMAVSNPAGSGKSVALRAYAFRRSARQVFYISCREWAKREFLNELCYSLGIDPQSAKSSIDALGQRVTAFFQERAHLRPLLIIDEADKLKAPALRYLIALYNGCEDKLGLVAAGTENFEKEVKSGVRFARKGYDELDSRFGRNFIHLVGATAADVVAICAANGIADKAAAQSIFAECAPAPRMVEGKQIKVVEDMRRVTRVIQRHLLQAREPVSHALPHSLTRSSAHSLNNSILST